MLNIQKTAVFRRHKKVIKLLELWTLLEKRKERK